jgi:hypothetical protein
MDEGLLAPMAKHAGQTAPFYRDRFGVALGKKFSHSFASTFTKVDIFPYAPTGKYEDFRSELT